MSSGPILLLERIESVSDGVQAIVRVSEPHWLRTSVQPALPQECLALLPGLARHRCESGSAHGIVSELANTETPHLVEHVALELLALAGRSRDTRGRTRWDFQRDGRGVFRVWIACGDIAAVLAALAGSIVIATWLLQGGDRPDVDALVREV
ncbi:MAG: cyanophycin synthetase family protein [Coriobacteriia bacterium]